MNTQLFYINNYKTLFLSAKKRQPIVTVIRCFSRGLIARLLEEQG